MPDPATPEPTTASDEADEPPTSPARERRCAVVVLAAGQGTRMKSRLPKPLHPVAGRPMIDVVLDAAQGCAPAQLVVVVGHGADQLREHLQGHQRTITFALQEEQLGTGHAVAAAIPFLDPAIDDVMVLFHDQPLITPEMVAPVFARHRGTGAILTIVSCVHPTGGQHGRISRDVRGRVIRITEARDAIGEPPGPKEINSGLHCFRRDWLAAHLSLLPRQPHGEYYLTDLVALAAAEAAGGDDAPWPVAAVPVELAAAMGVNDRVELAEAERGARRRVNERLMLAGVTIVDPASTFIDEGVTIGRDTTIGPFTTITGRTVIGEECRIGPGARIRDSTIAQGCAIVDSTIEEAEIGAGTDIGPYSHLRPGVRLAGGVHIGNFVEVKNATVGTGTQVGHVSYLGDATVGERVNIGAGTVTVNYDGHQKHRTTIGDGAFIGSDTMLRAPVEVGPGATTGAGSVVTRDVPAGRKVAGVPARPIPRHAAERVAGDDGQAASPTAAADPPTDIAPPPRAAQS